MGGEAGLASEQRGTFRSQVGPAPCEPPIYDGQGVVPRQNLRYR